MRPHRYRIVVSGRLGAITREVFADLCPESDGANTGLTGELDQAALYGVLNRILDLGLELMALTRIDDQPSQDQAPATVVDVRDAGRAGCENSIDPHPLSAAPGC